MAPMLQQCVFNGDLRYRFGETTFANRDGHTQKSVLSVQTKRSKLDREMHKLARMLESMINILGVQDKQLGSSLTGFLGTKLIPP